MSKRVVLLKAARIPPGGIHPSGTTVVVGDEYFSQLVARGQVAEESAEEPEESAEEPEESAEEPEESAEEPEEQVAEDPAPAAPELPIMGAPIAVWRDAAAKHGLKTAGMKKAEIIGAIHQHLGI